jgi:general secretion pathway protein F
MPAPRISPLPDAQRAAIHAQLAALERAGLPVSDALGMLRLGPGLQSRVAGAKRLLARGQNLAAAGAAAGLFTPLETTVLRAAIQAGSPAIAHERLASAATASARRGKQVRARLLLPLFVLAVALFVLPIPALMSGALGIASYLLQSVGVLLLLAAALALLRYVARLHAGGTVGPGRDAVEALLLRLPVFGEVLVRSQAQRFFENLALLVGSGVAMFEALPVATQTVSLLTMRADYQRLLPMLQDGMPLSLAVAALDYPGNPNVVGMIATGEGSGELADLLSRYAQGEGALVASRIDQLATWIPRIVYAILVVWIAQGVLGGFGTLLRRPLD